MRIRNQFIGTLVLFTASMNLAYGVTSSVEIKWRYQDAKTGRQISDHSSVSRPDVFDLDSNKVAYTDSRMGKTLFVIKMVNTLKNSLKAYEAVCKDVPTPRPVPMPHPIRSAASSILPTPMLPYPPHPPMPPWPSKDCKAKWKRIGQALQNDIRTLNDVVDSNPDLRSDKMVLETMDLSRKLAKNMIDAKQPRHPIYIERMGGGVRMHAIAGGLHLTAGGAQDFGFFRKTVEDDMVPSNENLTVEGFMSEFDLSLDSPACDELICVYPALAVDRAESKMFVQIAMNSNVTEATFKRLPLNLSIVLDISGSMSATDNTERSRLEWAKDALIRTVEELNEEDTLSIVLFDTKSEILLHPTRVTDKAAIIKKVKTLKTKGSTNLEAGLRDGYELVSEGLMGMKGFEHRVILISDAGLNTGVTDEANILRLVTDFSQEGIGLTAIGLGLNFNQKFIHAISHSKGGNYLFVHSGLDMFKYFESFDFLVTPVAYNFKAFLKLNGINAKLVKAYGIPVKEGEPVRDLIDVQTLFFSKAGGAMVLEYSLN